MFSQLLEIVRKVLRKMVPYKDIAQAERVELPITSEMINALDEWRQMYLNRAPWLSRNVKSLNLPSLICSEIVRQVLLELDWDISAGADENGNPKDSARAEYLKAEFARCLRDLRPKLEHGCAAGGMAVKPYPRNGHIYFDWATNWELAPVGFDGDGGMTDVVFRDSYQIGKSYYTRLERHVTDGDNVTITQRAFRSNDRNQIGAEVSLTEVPAWAELQPEVTVTAAEGQLFGWFKVASANNVDINSPLGASVYAKARGTIEEADRQYSRMLWEFEGAELAVDVDVTALKPREAGRRRPDGRPELEMPQLNDRLFRRLDLGSDDSYHVFSPAIRDESLVNGLNQLLIRIEDQCGLSRGTLSDANVEAKTATELRIIKQRSYATVAENQKALERCLRDVLRAMDKYATLYHLAPEGDWEASFTWDDSIITDSQQQMNERLSLVGQGLMSKAEFRAWYFGESKEQAEAALAEIRAERTGTLEELTLGGEDDGTEEADE